LSTQPAGSLAALVEPRALDIEERRAVETVEAEHVGLDFASREDFDHRGCDGVGPRRGAQGEDTDRLVAYAGAYGKLLHPDKYPWIAKLLAKKPAKLVAIAVANKTTRIAWAIMSKGGTYQPPALAAAA
jgi:hypothetical protein